MPPVEAALRRDFELQPEIDGAEGAITVPSDPVDAGFFERAGLQLRIVAQHAVGLDNVDLKEAERRGIVVSNTPDVLTDATGELTIALLLSLVRRVTEGDRLIRRGKWGSSGITFMLGHGLAGRELGILGMGRIGREVARLAEAHGMHVRALRAPGLEGLEEVDVLSLHCPLTDKTRHAVNAAAFTRMKPTAVLVNVARGPVVDEAALVDALKRGEIAGAALDVFEREPEVPEELLRRDDVVLCPHLGSATVETRTAMGMLCVEALRATLL